MYVTLLSSTCFGLGHAHPQEEQLHKHSALELSERSYMFGIM